LNRARLSLSFRVVVLLLHLSKNRSGTSVSQKEPSAAQFFTTPFSLDEDAFRIFSLSRYYERRILLLLILPSHSAMAFLKSTLEPPTEEVRV